MFGSENDPQPGGGYDIFSKGLDKLWQIFIQPERSLFDKSRLGGGRFRVDPHPPVYTRKDGKCPNLRGEELEYTLLEAEEQDPQTAGCCVVYLHSHGSSRAEGLSLLQSVASQQLDICLFDFAGSGYSGGEYCSLGIRESGDIKIILDCLRIRHGKTRFVMYGRSMGAAATIFLASQARAGLELLILDSPFCDVEQLVQDLGRHYAGGIGGFVGIAFFTSVQGEITKRLGFDPSIIKPIQVCSQIRTPTIIVAGEQDEMVGLSRLEEMLQAIATKEKTLLRVPGNHSAPRPQQVLHSIMQRAKERFVRAVVRDRKELENEQELLLEKVEINSIPSFQSKVNFLSKRPLRNDSNMVSHTVETNSKSTLVFPEDPMIRNLGDYRTQIPGAKSVTFRQSGVSEGRPSPSPPVKVHMVQDPVPQIPLTEKEEEEAHRWRPQIFSLHQSRVERGPEESRPAGILRQREPAGIFDSGVYWKTHTQDDFI